MFDNANAQIIKTRVVYRDHSIIHDDYQLQNAIIKLYTVQ